jgi:hypothetical protein
MNFEVIEQEVENAKIKVVGVGGVEEMQYSYD